MQLLLEITEKELGLPPSASVSKYTFRRAARAVVFNERGELALISTNRGNYKIPGGGIDEGEELIAAVKREAKEEAGCEIEIGEEVGCIIEQMPLEEFLQISYCYIAKTIGQISEPSFTEFEISKGFKLFWVPPDEALNLMENAEPTTYRAKFIQLRDLTFLKKAAELIPSTFQSL